MTMEHLPHYELEENQSDIEEQVEIVVDENKTKSNSINHDASIPIEKYLRSSSGRKIIKKTRDKKLKASLKKTEEKHRDAAISAARAEILLPEQEGFLEVENEMEKTYKFTQKQLAFESNLQTAEKIFDLTLDTFGPYRLNYSKNGRSLLLAGEKGHIAMIDTLRMKMATEFHVRETIRDVQFLHNHSMFAVAQKKHTYIYNSQGAEIHCLRNLKEPQRLDFLPYHFLLVSIGSNGILRYQDTSTGQIVVEHPTKLGLCKTMKQNPWNAVMSLGHSNGNVTMWTPNMSTPVVKMLVHQGPVKDLAIDRSGKYMVTTGFDRQLKIWDLRTYKELNTLSIQMPAHSIDISQRGVVGIGLGSRAYMYKDLFNQSQPNQVNPPPYMTHTMMKCKQMHLCFQPFEDVLTIGHNRGLSNLVIPGAGEANYDTFEANPFENIKQRRETEVRSLLEKLQPSMISLNPFEIGNMMKNPNEIHQDLIQQDQQANHCSELKKQISKKKKMRGRNKISKQLRRKQQNVIDWQREQLRQKREKNQKQMVDQQEKQQQKEQMPTALTRFLS